MGERSHTHRPRYIEFRFEQSLRKYEMPPRKIVKLDSSQCKNCDRKSCESRNENRLIRLCETRKLYNATSRQKASEFSRRKQANQMSCQKLSQNVSDFNCIDSAQHSSNIPKAYQQQQYKEVKISKTETIKAKLQQKQNVFKWSISIKQTPIKQQLLDELHIPQNEQIDGEEPSQHSQIEKQENKSKVKDIEFHIGLVEELHKKINQYIQIEAGILRHSQRVQGQEEGEGEQAINVDGCGCKMEEELALGEGAIQNSQTNQQSGEKQNINLEQHQIQISSIDQIKQLIQNQLLNTQKYPQKQIPTDIQSEPLHQKIGRIEIKCQKGRCLLSARIMNKLLQTSSTPEKVKKSVLKHHPYLENIECILKVSFQK